MKVREIKTVEGFMLDGTPQDILIKGGEVQQLTFWNKRAGTLVIQKKDSVTGALIAGAQFQLTYANGGYDIYLRPWGTYWVDVDGEELPDLYDTWYLPLIEAGKPMPDSLDSDAPESNLGGNTAGGDGIVTEEQVQKGYVWMNDVNKNIFDTTYEEVVAYFGVEGEFVKEEYSDHMKANYRYYKWISADNDSHFIYVNFKEDETGVYEVSGFNTSGFSGKEAIAKYLDIVKAEAAEENKAASANAAIKDFSAKVAMFAHDEINITIRPCINIRKPQSCLIIFIS